MTDRRIYLSRLLHEDGHTGYRLSLLATEDEANARLLLEQQTQAVVVSMHRFPDWMARLWQLAAPLLASRWPHDELADLLHNLGVMLKSGLPIADALKELSRDTAHPGIRRCALDLHASVSAGNSFSSSLLRYEHQIPPAVLGLVGIGEQSGDLDSTLIASGAHVRRLKTLRQNVGKTLIYPLFAIAAMVLAMLFWIYYVLPELSRMFRQMGAELPAYTVKAMDFVEWFRHLVDTGFWFSAAGIMLALAIVARVEAVRYQVFRVLYRLPISGVLIKSSALAFITEYLALLVRAGLPLTDSLRIIAEHVGNPFYARRLEAVRDGVFRGNTLSSEMARTEVFPNMVLRLVAVGEQTGTLDTQLQMLADDYRQRLAHVVASLGEILKPLLILMAGLFFVVMVVVFLLPVYQLIGQVMN